MMNKKIITIALSVCLALCLAIGAPLVINAASADDLQISYEYVQTQALMGERVQFPQVKAVNPEFVESVTVAVKTPSGKSIFASDKYFVPDEEGEYKYFITVKAYSGATRTENKTLTVTKADYPVLATAPYIPVAFVSGESYELPVAEFVDYNAATPAKTAYTVKYVTANGAESTVSGSFTPSVTVHGDKIKLVYTATSSVTGKSNIAQYSIPVLVAGTMVEGTPCYSYEKLFYTEDGASLTTVSDGVRIDLNKPAEIAFANKVGANFSLRLIPTAANSFDNVVITATDSENKDIAVSLEFVKNGDSATDTIMLLGGKRVSVAGSFLNTKEGVGVEFNNRSLYVRDDAGSNAAKITKTDDGRDFNGFPSGGVYLTVNVKTVNAASAFMVNYINKHYFDTDGFDFVSPGVIYKTQLKKSPVYAGETVKIPVAESADVIDPDVVVTVSVVKEGSTEPVKDVNGTPISKLSCDKDYYFVADQPGNYVVNYEAQDASGNKYTTGRNVVYVSDNVKPTIKINSAMPTKVNAGSKITLPEYTASDNGKYTVLVYAVCPSSGYVMLDGGASFTFTDKGTYYFHYAVFDEYFNFAEVCVKTECV